MLKVNHTVLLCAKYGELACLMEQIILISLSLLLVIIHRNLSSVLLIKIKNINKQPFILANYFMTPLTKDHVPLTVDMLGQWFPMLDPQMFLD